MRRAAYRLAGGQLAVTALVAAAAFAWAGGHAAASAAAGGGIGILAGLYQALRMFRVDAGADPRGFVRGVFAGEVVKILLTAALFVAAIRILEAGFAPMIIGYTGTFLVYWLALATDYPWMPAPAVKGRGWDDESDDADSGW